MKDVYDWLWEGLKVCKCECESWLHGNRQRLWSHLGFPFGLEFVHTTSNQSIFFLIGYFIVFYSGAYVLYLHVYTTLPSTVYVKNHGFGNIWHSVLPVETAFADSIKRTNQSPVAHLL